MDVPRFETEILKYFFQDLSGFFQDFQDFFRIFRIFSGFSGFFRRLLTERVLTECVKIRIEVYVEDR